MLTHELEQAQKRQRDLYVDLDSRMRKLEAAAGGRAAAASAAAAAAPPTGAPPTHRRQPRAAGRGAARRRRRRRRVAPIAGAEQRAYDAALDQFKRGDYPGAIASFNDVRARRIREAPLASSAQYWVGNAQFARKDYRAAIAAQRQLIQLSGQRKVPDALLNIASAQSELGDNAAARRTLEELIAQVPAVGGGGARRKQRLAIR